MTLAASSQRSQIIRSKFRSVLQLRIHRRYQDPNPGDPAPSSSPMGETRGFALRARPPAWKVPGPPEPSFLQPRSSAPGSPPAGLQGAFTFSPALDPDPWISAPGAAALAQAPVSPSGPAPFLFSPGVLLPEPEYRPWRSPKKQSPKTSPRWKKPKPKGNLTYHQYMPPEPRQGSGGKPQAEGTALGPSGAPLWEGANIQQPQLRTMAGLKPTPSPPGPPSPSPPPHKLELKTLKLEELTVSELRQQLRLRGLPVSGTKSMLLERMRGGAPPRERQKPRREDSPAGAPWPRLRPKALGAARRQASFKSSSASGRPPLPRASDTLVAAPAPAAALTPSSAPPPAALSLEEELQEAIRRAQLLPNRGIDDILNDPVEPGNPLPPIPLDFPGSFDVLSASADSEGLSSVFSSSLPSPTNSPAPAPRGPMDSLDWLEALSGGPPLGCGPPAPSIFSADFSDSSGTRLWDLLEDLW